MRLVGDACLWAATTEKAGETYNLTNGEVFSWRDMWPAIAETLGALSVMMSRFQLPNT